MALYENINGINYRVIYYWISTSWESGNRFEYYSDSNGHGYYYIDGSGNTSSTYYCFGDKADYTNTFSKIIGDYAAKIYLPADVTGIIFQSSKNASNKQRKTDKITFSSSTECLVLDTNNWSSWGDAGYQECTNYSKAVFDSMFMQVYFQISSAWNGGPITGLNNCYLYTNFVGTRYTNITDCIVKKYSDIIWAEVLIPTGTGTICLQNAYSTGASAAAKGVDQTPANGYNYIINSNNGASRQTIDWVPWVEPPEPTHRVSFGSSLTNVYVGGNCVALQIKTN